MTSEERIARLEEQIDRLQEKQNELYKQLARAERDQWQGRVDEVELQMHLGAMEANDRVKSVMSQLSTRWAESRAQFDEAASKAVSVRDTMRGGLESALREVRQALIDSRNKLAS